MSFAQTQPVVEVANIAMVHEPDGWRVTAASTTPIHFNLIKGDLIVRIDGKNASEVGPMMMTNLLNQDYRRQINLFIERGDLRLEIALRQIREEDFSPVGPNPFKHVAGGFMAPAAEFVDIENQPLTLDQFKGKWLLIDFMATWCAPCMETMPKVLQAVASDHLSLLMIALNDRRAVVLRMKNENGITAPIAMMSATAQLPISFGIVTNVWTGRIPALALVSPQGEVVLIHVGDNGCDELAKEIDSLMNRNHDND